MRLSALLIVLASSMCFAQEHRPDYSAKDIGARQIEQREAQAEKPAGPPLSLFAAPLAALERDLVRAEKQHDLALIESTLAPDFLEIAGNGQLCTKPVIMQVVKDIQIDDYALSDFRSVEVREDVGVVTYTATVRGSYRGQPFPRRNLLSSVWHKQKKGRWQMVFHTSSPIPPPPVSSAELEGLEQDFLARLAAADADWMKQIVSDDAILIGEDGKRESKAIFVDRLSKALPTGQLRVPKIEVRPFGSDMGIVTYTTGRQEPGKSEVARVTFTSMWRRSISGWQMVFHQVTAGPPVQIIM